MQDEHAAGMGAPPGGMAATMVVRLGYRGAGFAGFAEQPGQRTVAGELRTALETLLHRPVDLTCAGRTDAGVNALAQYVSLPVTRGSSSGRGDDSSRRSWRLRPTTSRCGASTRRTCPSRQDSTPSSGAIAIASPAGAPAPCSPGATHGGCARWRTSTSMPWARRRPRCWASMTSGASARRRRRGCSRQTDVRPAAACLRSRSFARARRERSLWRLTCVATPSCITWSA